MTREELDRLAHKYNSIHDQVKDLEDVMSPILKRLYDIGYAAGAAAEREKYNELLMAVGKKFPNESRHETALRYIREAESKSDCAKTISAMGEK